jgi:hypothetical protein
VGDALDANAGRLLEGIIERGAYRLAWRATDVGHRDLLGRAGARGPDRRHRHASRGDAGRFQ